MSRIKPLLASMALVVGASALADDVVLVPNSTVKGTGGIVRGQVIAESPTEVKIKATVGGEQTVPVDQIASIKYDGVGQSYAQAEIRENGGQIAEALDLYKKAVTENSAKPYVAGSAKFHRASLLTDAAFASPSKAKDAIDELESYVKAYPQGRHLIAAEEALIRLHLQAGDSASAQKVLARLRERVPSAAASGRVAILEARILTKAGKADEAIASLNKVIESSKGTPRGREAQLAKAECLVATKKYDEALSVVQDVIKDSPPEDASVQAVAHNTLGDCYRAAGRPKDALIAYLKTDILFDKDKEQHPRALAMIEQIFRELKVDARADEIHDRLKGLYPQSPYLVKGGAK